MTPHGCSRPNRHGVKGNPRHITALADGSNFPVAPYTFEIKSDKISKLERREVAAKAHASVKGAPLSRSQPDPDFIRGRFTQSGWPASSRAGGSRWDRGL